MKTLALLLLAISVQAQCSYSDSLIAAKDYKAAIVVLTGVIESGGDCASDPYFSRGLAEFEEYRFKEAEADLKWFLTHYDPKGHPYLRSCQKNIAKQILAGLAEDKWINGGR